MPHALQSIDDLIKELTDRLQSTTASPLPVKKPIDSDPIDLAHFIDHTLLKQEATRSDILALCEEARIHGFASVCVQPSHVATAKEALRGSHVVVCSVVGFPLGVSCSATKSFEAALAVKNGAGEIDMVIHIGWLREREYTLVLEDIRQVVLASQPSIVKVILETSLLTMEEKIIGALLSKLAGAHFVKTSTGFAKGGATPEDVSLLRHVVGPEMGVKASGGIRNRQDAEKMIAAGANRLGTSSSISIVSKTTPSEQQDLKKGY